MAHSDTALTVLLKVLEKDKTKFEKRILVNVKELKFPFPDKIKHVRFDHGKNELDETIKSNLGDIVSAFVQKLASTFIKLTPAELRVANNIRQGKTSKEAAGFLDMSARPFDIFRYNIKKNWFEQQKEKSCCFFFYR